jgi:hypothetical protein
VASPRALIDARSPHPARYFAEIVAQMLHHGLPSRRRAGALLALLGRKGVPEESVAFLARRFPRRPRPELDRLLEQLAARWSELAAASKRLPRECPQLSAFALRRQGATTVFVFGDFPHPLLVAKLPGDVERLENEARALTEAELAGIAPRVLGRFETAYVQEGLRGGPLRVRPLTPKTALHLDWSGSQRQLAAALIRLAEVTAKRARPREFSDPLEPALERASLSATARRAAAAAWRDARRLEIAVLRHRDTSPQNCLFEEDRFAGIVDWERAHTDGAPGFDAWNAALAFLEHGAGLRRWSRERVIAIFREACQHSTFWREATLAARASARAAGAPETMLDSLEVAFFARRLLGRATAPDRFPTDSVTAANMLEMVCGR